MRIRSAVWLAVLIYGAAAAFVVRLVLKAVRP
jgi:hypothetical protein